MCTGYAVTFVNQVKWLLLPLRCPTPLSVNKLLAFFSLLTLTVTITSLSNKKKPSSWYSTAFMINIVYMSALKTKHLSEHRALLIIKLALHSFDILDCQNGKICLLST